jgi:hypothetical protein
LTTAKTTGIEVVAGLSDAIKSVPEAERELFVAQVANHLGSGAISDYALQTAISNVMDRSNVLFLCDGDC